MTLVVGQVFDLPLAQYGRLENLPHAKNAMSESPSSPGKEQQLLRHARREGLVIMTLWAAALLWSVSTGYLLGYRRSAAEMSLILGIPDWICWSVILPWAVCLLFSIWFCFRYMADDDLGQDPDEGPDRA